MLNSLCDYKNRCKRTKKIKAKLTATDSNRRKRNGDDARDKERVVVRERERDSTIEIDLALNAHIV